MRNNPDGAMKTLGVIMSANTMRITDEMDNGLNATYEKIPTQISALCNMEREFDKREVSYVELLRHIYAKFEMKNEGDPRVQFYNCGGEHLILYLEHRKMFSVTTQQLKKKMASLKEIQKAKFVTWRGRKVVVIRERKFKAQGLVEIWDSVSSMFDKIIGTMSATRDLVNGVCSLDFRLLVVDMLGLVVEIRDGFFTPTKVFTIMLRLFTSYHRYNKIFHKQSLGISDLFIGYAALGLPSRLLDAMKTVATLTGKKTLDSEVLLETAVTVLDLLGGVIDFFKNLSDAFLPAEIAGLLKGMFAFFSGGLRNYRLIKKVAVTYTRFLRNDQIIFDPSFREEVVELHTTCINSDGFMEYVSNNGNRYFRTTWDNFEQGLYKGIKVFDESRREEPVCIVFEGPAGSGKSALMNNFVDLLRTAGSSVYVHSVPSSEDAKDFYDDYENQDVFVMDDVGQQGKSQWRYIINFVSPTKYPLPCASAQKKNTKFFTSKVIVCTTNHLMDLSAFTSSDCISDPHALRRRCHVIKVEKDKQEEGFAQILQYFKYDHMSDNPTWKNEFLYHNAEIPETTTVKTREIPPAMRMRYVLRWIYSILQKVRANEERERSYVTMTTEYFRDIIEEVNEVFSDVPTYTGQSGEIFAMAMQHLHNGAQIAREWFTYISESVLSLVSTFMSSVAESVARMFNGDLQRITIRRSSFPKFLQKYLNEEFYIFDVNQVLLCATACTGIAFAVNAYSNHKRDQESQAERMRKDMEVCKQKIEETFSGFSERLRAHYLAQGERLHAIAKHVKLVEIMYRGEISWTHGVVSGTRILLPCHVRAAQDEVFINIYSTMEHFENNHREAENVTLKVGKLFPSVDLAVYEMHGVVPLYKKCKNLFVETQFCKGNDDLHLMNSMGSVPVKVFVNIQPNFQDVTYEGYVLKTRPNGTTYLDDGRIVHQPWSGYMTPLSGPGMCGTVLASDTAGIVAFHVAGADGVGFMVKPTGYAREAIREAMLEGAECPLEIDDKVIPNFSGARMRYDNGQITTTQVHMKTNLVPTGFHVDYNPDTRKLISVLEQEKSLDVKGPPRFDAKGSNLATLESLSQKTFKHQGYIEDDELEFVGNCIGRMIPHFSDLTDEETVFGNERITAMNKDSSNGYGWEKDKEVYFDFQHKVITDKGREMIDAFENAAEREDYDVNMFLSRETFKDELRKTTKQDEPRTFRVMPLPHIFWTKKLCGDLLLHFKDNMHKFGCCVGFNPYKDFDELYKKLAKCAITGDIDFAKWDGSINARLMEEICFQISKKYQGRNGKVLDYVFKTMTRSWVLTGDSVWATTHGLPSGTWLTLLMNCLINKALSALVLFRNKADAVPADMDALVDYVMGDDKIFGAPRRLEKVFNLKTINDVAVSLGMTCTNGDKTPIVSVSQELRKLTFVKRSFYFHPELKRWIGALDLGTLVNTIQWYDSTKDKDVVLAGKIRSVQVEAYIHGKGVYKLFMDVFEKYSFGNSLFTEDEIRRILTSEEGYVEVQLGLGKDASYLRNE